MRQIQFLLPPLFLLLAGSASAADRGTTQRDEGFRGAVTAPLALVRKSSPTAINAMVNAP